MRFQTNKDDKKQKNRMRTKFERNELDDYKEFNDLKNVFGSEEKTATNKKIHKKKRIFKKGKRKFKR